MTERRLKFVFLAAGLILLLAAAWFARMAIAGWAAETWLGSHGVEARVDVSRLDFGGVDASLRMGDAQKPDFSADRVSLAFAPHGWFALQSLDVKGAFLRVRFDGSKFTVGQLQTLIDSLTAPAKTAAPSAVAQAEAVAPSASPLPIRIDHALVHVDAPQGTLEIAADAALKGAELETLNARIEPASLSGAKFHASIREGTAEAMQTPDGLRLRAQLSGSVSTKTFGFDGADIALDADGLRWTHTADGLRITGNTTARLSAAKAGYGDYALNNLQSVTKTSGTVGSDMSLDMHVASSISGEAAGDTAQKLAGKIPADDAKTKRALAAALQSLHADIAAHVMRANGQTVVALDAPIVLTGRNGAVLTVSPENRALVSADKNGIDGGGRATLEGRGLPAISLEVPVYALRNDGTFTAETTLDARFSAFGLRNAHIASNGALVGTADATLYRPNGCARISVAAVTQKGKASLERLRATLCPVPEKNLLTLADGGWSVDGRLRNTSAHIAGAQTSVSDAVGRFQLAADRSGALDGHVHVANAELHDLSSPPRFKPISASGNLVLGDDRAKGTFALASGKEKLAQIALSHSLKTGNGRADIAADAIAFKPGGFQPSDISPLLAQVARADGNVRFDGRIAWTKKGMTSEGQLDVNGLDFNTPLGAASGTTTHVTFTSLMPLQTAPGQTVAISRIGWITPLTDASAEFEIDPGTLRLTNAGTDIAQGRLTLDPMRVPLASGETFAGAVRIANVDLGMIVAASNLADKISIKARIEGAVPFSVGPEGLRLTDGSVVSLAPGSLSIKRSLWSSGDETGGKSNAIRDFAFQALEHLAIDKMSGKVESQPKGRLRVVLNIKGYNDPPVPVEARVDVFSLWNGTAFDKPLPLPAKTPVDLTLDTSLNFDELLRAYRNAWQADQADTTGTKP